MFIRQGTLESRIQDSTAELQSFAEPPRLCYSNLKLMEFLILSFFINIFDNFSFQLVFRALRIQETFKLDQDCSLFSGVQGGNVKMMA